MARLGRRSLAGLVLIACAAVAVRTFVPFGGATVDTLFSDYLYYGALIASGLLCLLRGLTEREERSAWLLFAVAIASWTAGDIYYTVVLQDLRNVPFPSLADAGYLGFYAPAYVAFLMLVRSRVTRFPPSLCLDGAIVTLMAAALAESILLPTVLGSTGGSAAAVATNLAYPVADSLLLALAFSIVVFGGFRLSLDCTIMIGALLVFSAADSVYVYQVANDTYVAGHALDLGWLFGLSLAGVAACMPRAEVAERDAIEGWATIVVPAALAVAAIGVEIFDHFKRLSVLPVALASGVIGLSVVRLVLTFAENQRLLSVSRRDAGEDALTGLPNRRALLARTERLFRAPISEPHVLAIYDLDGFKLYNDTFGHLAGDALLARLGARMKDAMAGRADVFRLGGDEFCLLARATGAEAFELVAEAGECLIEEGDQFVVRSSFGTAFMPEEAGNATDALRLADRRMYAQKATRPSHLAGTRDALLVALHERDQNLGDHVDDVSRLAVAVAAELRLDDLEIENVRSTAELHDIGKLGIPDGILLKPEPLTADERSFIEAHTVIGERILAAAPATGKIARYVRATHERWDGAGYPDGLSGDDIPLAARVVFVCDAYSAMISPRPYQATRTPDDALAELRAHAGAQFDPAVVAAFARVLANAAVAA
jgi:two-component system cell cycle response regulator